MCVVPNMAVFRSSLIPYFPGTLLRYCLSDFETVPVTPVATDITFVFTFHMRWIYILTSLHFRIFTGTFINFLITFLSPVITTSINTHVPFSLSRITLSGLLLGMVLSVRTCWFLNMATLIHCLIYNNFVTRYYQFPFSNFTAISLHMLKFS